jgi:hypothetical protein
MENVENPTGASFRKEGLCQGMEAVLQQEGHKWLHEEIAIISPLALTKQGA